MNDEERKRKMASAIAAAVARKGRVESQTDDMAVIVWGRPVNHLLHLVLTLVTVGFWVPVWIVLAVFGGEKRYVITIDEFGNILNQRA